MHAEQEQERSVVVSVRPYVVVDQQHEEYHRHADHRCRQRLQQLFQSRFPQHIAVGPLKGVQRQPSHGHQHQSQPEVGIPEHAVHVSQSRLFLEHLPEQEQQRPRHHCAQGVADDVFQNLFFFQIVVFVFWVTLFCPSVGTLLFSCSQLIGSPASSPPSHCLSAGRRLCRQHPATRGRAAGSSCCG